MRRLTNADLMLGYRLRRWPNNKTALDLGNSRDFGFPHVEICLHSAESEVKAYSHNLELFGDSQ